MGVAETRWYDLKNHKPLANHITANGLSLQCVIAFSGYGHSVFSGLYDCHSANWRVVDEAGQLTDRQIHNSTGQTLWCYMKDFRPVVGNGGESLPSDELEPEPSQELR